MAGLEARKAADQKLLDFRTMGGRRQTVDKFNSLRKITWADLSKIQHEHPDSHLPNDFADMFFRHESRVRGKTSAEVQAQIAVLEAEIQRQKTLFADQKALDEIHRKATRAAYEAAQREAEEAVRHANELRAAVDAGQ